MSDVEPTLAPDEGPVAWSLLPDTAECVAGALVIGGCPVTELAGTYGTPLFVYDERHLRARCRDALDAWGDGVAYATKAFLCRAMASLASEEGLNLDVSTGGELHVALAAGVPPHRLVLHGNNKSTLELTSALAAGVGRVVVDSFDEIDRLGELLAGSGATAGLAGVGVQVLVRVTPGVEAHTHEFVRTGQEDSKFGFGLASGDARRAAERLRSMVGVELVGAHMHIGSQIFRSDSFARAIELVAPFVCELDLPELCVGGGLGVAYVAGERAPTIAAWAAAARDACRAAGIPSTVRLTAEPGRAIAAGAAITVYRVGTVKTLAGGRTYVAVDGGMSDNPRPVLYGSGYEAFVPDRVGAPRPRAVTVVGKHCESGDVLVADARVPGDLEVGDLLATPVTGAYGYSMASNYNKVPRPAVLFVADGHVRVAVRRESLDDLLTLDG